MTEQEKRQLESKLLGLNKQLEVNERALLRLPNQIEDLKKQIAEINAKLKQ